MESIRVKGRLSAHYKLQKTTVPDLSAFEGYGSNAYLTLKCVDRFCSFSGLTRRMGMSHSFIPNFE